MRPSFALVNVSTFPDGGRGGAATTNQRGCAGGRRPASQHQRTIGPESPLPNPAVAPWASLLSQPAMLRHLALALALWTVVVCRMERVDPGDVFQLELGHVGVDHHEPLLVEKDAVGQTQLPTSPSGPPVHGPRLRIATGRDSKASDPSPQSTCKCVSLRDRHVL